MNTPISLAPPNNRPLSFPHYLEFKVQGRTITSTIIYENGFELHEDTPYCFAMLVQDNQSLFKITKLSDVRPAKGSWTQRDRPMHCVATMEFCGYYDSAKRECSPNPIKR